MNPGRGHHMHQDDIYEPQFVKSPKGQNKRPHSESAEKAPTAKKVRFEDAPSELKPKKGKQSMPQSQNQQEQRPQLPSLQQHLTDIWLRHEAQETTSSMAQLDKPSSTVQTALQPSDLRKRKGSALPEPDTVAKRPKVDGISPNPQRSSNEPE
jgi:hypothetical protein